MSSFRVVVGIPSGSTWVAQFAVDVVNLVSNFTKKQVGLYGSQSLQVVNVRSSVLPQNRLDLVRAAKELKASHLLFLDSDHTFPSDLIHRLASHHQQIVAANCVTKTIPATSTARAFSEKEPRGIPVYSDPGSHGLEQVWRVGTGIMLVHMPVFDRVPEDCWEMRFLPGPKRYQGEDWAFCEACEKANIPIFIDHDVSKLVGHVGNYEYTTAVIGEVQHVAR